MALAALQNAQFSAGDIRRGRIAFMSSVELLCNAGFVLATSSPAQCTASATLTCSLVPAPEGDAGGGGVTTQPGSKEVDFAPALGTGAASCVPAPCRPLPPPPHTTILQPPAAPVHGVTVTVACNAGYRAVPQSRNHSSCSDATFYQLTCLGCKFVHVSAP